MNEATRKRICSLRLQLCEKPAITCAHCGVHIHEAITGKYETNTGILCRRCFSDALGDEIEKHPVRAMPPEKLA